MEEIWRDIPGYEGYYQASNLGRIRSLDRWVNHNYGGRVLKRGRIITPHKSVHYGKVRMQAHLSLNGKVKGIVWARCIYSAFYGPIPEGMQINHIDENPANNRLDNLNLMTPKENTNWGTGNQRRARKNSIIKTGKHLYEKNPKARRIIEYNKDNIPIIEWFSIKAAAEYHKKHYTTIMLILEGKTKSFKDGTYFKYKREVA